MSSPVAVVTGANRGIGRECVRQLAELGYTVVLTARNKSKAEATAHAMVKTLTNGTIVPFQLDVTSADAVARAALFVHQELGGCEVLINNAGAIFDDPAKSSAMQTSGEVLKQTFENNTVGAYEMIRAFAPLMTKGGRIVNVSSGMGGLAEMGAGYPGYRISKAALHAVTRIFHAELHDKGILVNAVCPGWVRTDLGGPNASRDVKTGASGVVWAATLGADGPSGGFFRDKTALPW